MPEEADLLQAALKLLEQRRKEGPVNLREVADAVLRIVESSRAGGPISAEERRRLGCDLIKSEISRRWDDAVAATLSNLPVEYDAYETDESQTPATAETQKPAGPKPVIPVGLRPPALEELLAQWPGELDDYTSVLDLSAHEFSVRKVSGDDPKIAEYSERFADLADVLQHRLEDVEESIEADSSIRMLLRDTDPMFRFRQQSEKSAAAESASPADDDLEVTQHWEREQTLLNKALQRVDFFRDLSVDLRQAVVKKLALSPFAEGDYLLRQGEPADGLLVLLEGEARVMVEEHGRIHEIAKLARRTVIGEMGLVTQAKRTASVVATTQGWAATLSREDFELLAARNSLLSISLAELIAQRLGTVTVDVLCGKQIDRYEIRQRLGRGGMAIVYLAIDREDSQPVALKMLPHDRALDLMSSRRFRQEAEIVRKLTHPNVVRVLREFSEFGTTFIVMEWCDGPSLAQMLRRTGPLYSETAQKLIGQLAAGLLHTHAAGIAHRDLKPSNVLMTRKGEAKLADFGLARTLALDAPELTQVGEMMGTPKYMAPEQVDGERGDQRSDLYSLGCIAYEIWTGRPVFQSTSWRDLVRERASWVLPLRADIVPSMELPIYEFLCAALREDPQNRDVDLAEIAGWAGTVDWSEFPEVSDLFTELPANFPAGN